MQIRLSDQTRLSNGFPAFQLWAGLWSVSATHLLNTPRIPATNPIHLVPSLVSQFSQITKKCLHREICREVSTSFGNQRRASSSPPLLDSWPRFLTIWPWCLRNQLFQLLIFQKPTAWQINCHESVHTCTAFESASWADFQHNCKRGVALLGQRDVKIWTDMCCPISPKLWMATNISNKIVWVDCS